MINNTVVVIVLGIVYCVAVVMVGRKNSDDALLALMIGAFAGCTMIRGCS